MKNRFLKLFLIPIIFAMISTSSCKKLIDNAYLQPNAPAHPDIEAILPGVIGGMTWFSSNAGTAFGVIVDGSFIARYIQYLALNSSGDTWGMMSMLGGAVDNGGGLWAMYYYAHGNNVNRIIQWGIEQEKWDYVGVALAIRAWGMLELTNEYSDGPLKEAWNPDLQQFHYDAQPEFYDSVRATCHRALMYLNMTGGNVSQANLAKGDAYFYNGDVNKWKKFVYGVLTRSFGNLTKKDIFKANNYLYADSVIFYGNKAMTSNDDNAYVKTAGGAINGQNHYWGPFRGNLGVFRQGKYIADLMAGRNTVAFNGVFDPRCWYMLSENQKGEFRGWYPWNGSAETPLTADYPKNFWRHPTPSATVGPTPDSSRYLYANTSPWPIMTASEIQFLIAEAAFVKGNKQVAYDAYKNGISLDFDLLTTMYPQNIPAGKEITPAVKAAYMTNPLVVPATSAGLTLRQIMLQKYIALFFWGAHQSWVDLRKYHYNADLDADGKPVYADFTPPSGSNLTTTNNLKLTYRMRPRFNSEYLYNVPELTRIGAYQNADYNTYEMWFSMK